MFQSTLLEQEHQLSMIRQGIMGYLWGAFIIVQKNLTFGEITIHRESDPDRSTTKSMETTATRSEPGTEYYR